MADVQLEDKISGALREAYFKDPNDLVDVSDGPDDSIHIVIVSRKFDGRRMKEKNPNPIYENVELISTHPATDNRIKEILLFVPPEGFEKKEAWFDWEAFQKSVRNISEEITD